MNPAYETYIFIGGEVHETFRDVKPVYAGATIYDSKNTPLRVLSVTFEGTVQIIESWPIQSE